MASRSPGTTTASDRSTVETGEYASALFERFTTALDRLGPDARVLDLGSTTPVNLTFWAQRGHRVAALDLVARIGRGETIDLTGQEFGGVICWNTLACMPRPAAASVTARLLAALRPGGVLFAIFDGDGRTAPPSFRYRIADEARLAFEPVAWPNPPRSVSTNEIESLLDGFSPTRLTVMRHGSREALGHRPV